MIKSKAGHIAPYQLFFIIFVSRAVVTLTYVQTVSVGKLSSDLLISVFLSYVLTMLACIPVYLCTMKHRNPFSVKWLAPFYALYFVYFSTVNVSRFSYFATSRLTPDSSVAFFVIAILLCACYASIMGIEGISRFGTFCGVILLLTAIMVVLFNIKNVSIVDFFPFIENTKTDILRNSLVFTSNSIEPAVFMAIEDKVNGDKKKPLFLGITASYVLIALLVVLCRFVMGAASGLQAYPIFTLFQLASLGTMSRLDIFHTAFWILALFLKVSLLLFSASMCIKRYKHSTKCVVAAVVSAVVAFLITEVAGTAMINITKLVSGVLFIIFSFIVPLLSIILIRKNRIDGVVEEIRDN